MSILVTFVRNIQSVGDLKNSNNPTEPVRTNCTITSRITEPLFRNAATCKAFSRALFEKKSISAHKSYQVIVAIWNIVRSWGVKDRLAFADRFLKVADRVRRGRPPWYLAVLKHQQSDMFLVVLL